MKLGNIRYACERMSIVFLIPIRLYCGNRFLCSFGLYDAQIDPVAPYIDILLQKERRMSYYQTLFYQYFGVVVHGDYSIILGPIGRSAYTAQEKRDYAHTLGIGKDAFEQLYKQMQTTPDISLPSFMHILLLLNFVLNREKLAYSDIAPYVQTSGESHDFMLSAMQTNDGAVGKQPAEMNTLLAFERQMLSLVRIGDVGKVKQFFENNQHGTAKALSNNRLRHIKNSFIVTATLVSRTVADCGLDDDEALNLCAEYILQSEGLSSIEAILGLLVQMVVDYTRRVSKLGNTQQLSPMISSVVSLIKQNIPSPFETQAMANMFYISRKTLAAKFKRETGKTISAFISDERIRRAEILLRHSNKSLAEIADYLGYASQSHFQTRFKTAMQQTPQEYRKSKLLFTP
jgi:AraC-like DNA-binding protein